MPLDRRLLYEREIVLSGLEGAYLIEMRNGVAGLPADIPTTPCLSSSKQRKRVTKPLPASALERPTAVGTDSR